MNDVSYTLSIELVSRPLSDLSPPPTEHCVCVWVCVCVCVCVHLNEDVRAQGENRNELAQAAPKVKPKPEAWKNTYQNNQTISGKKIIKRIRKIMIKAAPKQMINYLQIFTQGQENKTSTQKKHINKDNSAALWLEVLRQKKHKKGKTPRQGRQCCSLGCQVVTAAYIAAACVCSLGFRV